MIFVMNLLNPPTLFLLLNIFKVERNHEPIWIHCSSLFMTYTSGYFTEKKSFDIYRYIYIYIYAQIQSFNQNFIHFKMP